MTTKDQILLDEQVEAIIEKETGIKISNDSIYYESFSWLMSQIRSKINTYICDEVLELRK